MVGEWMLGVERGAQNVIKQFVRSAAHSAVQGAVLVFRSGEPHRT